MQPSDYRAGRATSGICSGCSRTARSSESR